jgi:hypothetical protein
MAPGLRPLLAKSGARIVEVPPAETFEQIRAVHAAGGRKTWARVRAAKPDRAEWTPNACWKAQARQKAADGDGMGHRRLCAGKGGLFDTMLTAARRAQWRSGGFRMTM